MKLLYIIFPFLFKPYLPFFFFWGFFVSLMGEWLSIHLCQFLPQTQPVIYFGKLKKKKKRKIAISQLHQSSVVTACSHASIDTEERTKERQLSLPKFTSDTHWTMDWENKMKAPSKDNSSEWLEWDQQMTEVCLRYT